MFKPGISGNPRGRPKGSYTGRTRALALIDQLLSKKHNQKELLEDLFSLLLTMRRPVRDRRIRLFGHFVTRCIKGV